MPKYVVKQPKNQRPMINDSYTASVKKKMGVAFLPFIIGALALVFAMGAGIEDKAVRLIVLLVGLVLFLFGIIVILKSTKDLKDYAMHIGRRKIRRRELQRRPRKSQERRSLGRRRRQSIRLRPRLLRRKLPV